MKRTVGTVISVLMLACTLLGPTAALAGEPKDECVDFFFALVDEEKYEEAFEYLFPKTTWVDPTSDSFRPLKNDLLAIGNSVGAYIEHVMMSESGIAEHFVVRQYYVAFERQPMRFQFQLYNRNDKWTIQGINYEYGFPNEIDQLSIEELKNILIKTK